MGFRSSINPFRGKKTDDTLDQHLRESQRSMPKEIVELIQRKQRILGDKVPKPDTPEAVIEARLDQEIEKAWKDHEGKAQ